MRSSPPSARFDGYTLIEVLGSVLLLVVIGSMLLAGSRPAPRSDARDAALRIRGMLVAALAEAEAEGGEVLVRAESGPAGTRTGRFLALAGPPGVVPADDPSAGWVALEEGVAWRAGTATVDPMGAATDGRVPGTVRCTAEACGTGDGDYTVYFIGHVRRAQVAWALVLTREREVQLFEWNAVDHRWETEPR